MFLFFKKLRGFLLLVQVIGLLLDFLGRSVVADGRYCWHSVNSFARSPSIDVSLVEKAGEEDKVRKVHKQRHLDVVFADVARFTILLQL